MKKTGCWMKDVFALALSFVGLALAVVLMMQGEQHAAIADSLKGTPEGNATLVQGIMLYFRGIGGAILLAAIGWILIGYQDDRSTRVAPPTSQGPKS
jgi:hypothetical protein